LWIVMITRQVYHFCSIDTVAPNIFEHWSDFCGHNGICDDECACQTKVRGQVKISEAGRRGIVDKARFGLRSISVSGTT
jgi:hypothetical protein